MRVCQCSFLVDANSYALYANVNVASENYKSSKRLSIGTHSLWLTERIPVS